MKGIGSDLIDIRRIDKTIARFGDRFKKRIFTDNEIKKRFNFFSTTKFSKSERFVIIVSLADTWPAINKKIISFKLKVLIAINPSKRSKTKLNPIHPSYHTGQAVYLYPKALLL